MYFTRDYVLKTAKRVLTKVKFVRTNLPYSECKQYPASGSWLEYKLETDLFAAGAQNHCKLLHTRVTRLMRLNRCAGGLHEWRPKSCLSRSVFVWITDILKRCIIQGFHRENLHNFKNKETN